MCLLIYGPSLAVELRFLVLANRLSAKRGTIRNHAVLSHISSPRTSPDRAGQTMAQQY